MTIHGFPVLDDKVTWRFVIDLMVATWVYREIHWKGLPEYLDFVATKTCAFQRMSWSWRRRPALRSFQRYLDNGHCIKTTFHKTTFLCWHDILKFPTPFQSATNYNFLIKFNSCETSPSGCIIQCTRKPVPGLDKGGGLFIWVQSPVQIQQPLKNSSVLSTFWHVFIWKYFIDNT